jgi:hypothetical protein
MSYWVRRRDRLREALRLQPSSARAKWNLELAERRKPPPPPSNSGAAEVAEGSRRPEANRRRRHRLPAEQPSSGLSQSQAEQILSSMERRERETREEQQRRMHGALLPESRTGDVLRGFACAAPGAPELHVSVDEDHVAVGEEILYTIQGGESFVRSDGSDRSLP